jgi:hypothetical protein
VDTRDENRKGSLFWRGIVGDQEEADFVCKARVIDFSGAVREVSQSGGENGQGSFLGGCAQSKKSATLCSGRRMSAHGNFPAGYAWPHILLYYFTEITITTPPLTRILNRLIGGGIILCGDVV